MTRYGGQYGPDITFVGVERCDLDDPGSYADADVVIIRIACGPKRAPDR